MLTRFVSRLFDGLLGWSWDPARDWDNQCVRCGRGGHVSADCRIPVVRRANT